MLDNFKALRAAMTPLRRVAYEVGLAMDLAGHLGIGPRIERWLAATRLNLLAFLEKGQSNEN